LGCAVDPCELAEDQSSPFQPELACPDAILATAPATLMEDRNIQMNIGALSQYDGHARVALPIISNLMNRASMNLRMEAQAAIARITSDTNRVSP
jgi:hypothetical protein